MKYNGFIKIISRKKKRSRGALHAEGKMFTNVKQNKKWIQAVPEYTRCSWRCILWRACLHSRKFLLGKALWLSHQATPAMLPGWGEDQLLFPHQLLAHAPGKTPPDVPGAWVLLCQQETQTVFYALGNVLAQPQAVTDMCKVNQPMEDVSLLSHSTFKINKLLRNKNDLWFFFPWTFCSVFILDQSLRLKKKNTDFHFYKNCICPKV